MLKQQLNAVQGELEKEQGKAARLSGFIQRLQGFGISPTGRIPRREFAETLIQSVQELIQAERVLLLQLDPVGNEFLPAASHGFSPESLGHFHVRWSEGIMGRAARDLKSVEGNGMTSSESELLSTPHMVIPLPSQGHCGGLLVITKSKDHPFTPEDREMALLLSGQAAIFLESHSHYENLEILRDQIVRVLARTIEAKDTITHTHSARTQALVRAVAQEIGLPDLLIRQMEHGAFLHDIGKIGIADSILKKGDLLTPEEYTIMKNHPRIGQNLLETLPHLRTVGAIVLYHQEWYNGTGYPEGLAGDEIPLGARIVQVIDAWDAMTSNRTYHKAMPKSAAMAELRRQAGTQFDPKIVDLFLRVVDRLERDGIPTTEQPGEESLAAQPA